MVERLRHSNRPINNLNARSAETQSLGAQDSRYTLKVPNGLAFSESRGYEDWQAVGPSQTEAANVIRLIRANSMKMRAYRAGIPANGEPSRFSS
jgi:hypothetical protein